MMKRRPLALAALLAAAGPYARMWRRQSGGFVEAAE